MDGDVQMPVNLGNLDERTFWTSWRPIVELTGSDSDIVSDVRPPQDLEVRRPDIEKTRTELGWEPEVLLEGLERTNPHSQSTMDDG